MSASVSPRGRRAPRRARHASAPRRPGSAAEQVQRPGEQRVQLVGAEPHLERGPHLLVGRARALGSAIRTSWTRKSSRAAGARGARRSSAVDDRVQLARWPSRVSPALRHRPVPARRAERQHQPCQRLDAELERLEQVRLPRRGRSPVSACQSIAQQASAAPEYSSIGCPSTHESACGACATDRDLGDQRLLEQRLPELVALAMVLGPVGEEEALRVPLRRPMSRPREIGGQSSLFIASLSSSGLVTRCTGRLPSLNGTTSRRPRAAPSR